MKTYLLTVSSPFIFVLGNIFVAIVVFVKFIAKTTETISHATYKWCNHWNFCTFNDIINDIVTEHKK